MIPGAVPHPRSRDRQTWHDRWVITATLLAIAVVHFASEALFHSETHEDINSVLLHVPAALYVVPVAYAGLAYGLSGGLTAGLASVVLTLPNMLLWHRTSWAWLGEGIFILIVVVLGAGLALPAARERRRRDAAEREVRRLALLNEIGEGLASAPDLEEGVDQALRSITSELGLEGAGLALWTRDREDPILVTCMASDEKVRASVEKAVSGQAPRAIEVGPTLFDDGVIRVALSGISISGALAILPDEARAESNVVLLQLATAVAHQMATDVENMVLRRQEQQHLEEFVDLATRLQEAERARIAREIHDETAQSLSLMGRGLRDLSKRADPQLLEGPLGIRELARLSETTMQSLRSFARELRPATLDSLGLDASLEWLARDFESRVGFNPSLSVAGSLPPIEREAEVTMFRIVQEALRNIERHAEATSASISISHLDGTLHIVVEDDGRGFVPPDRLTDLIREGRLGLVGMRERARLIGGNLTIGSQPGDGATVTVTADLTGIRSRPDSQRSSGRSAL